MQEMTSGPSLDVAHRSFQGVRLVFCANCLRSFLRDSRALSDAPPIGGRETLGRTPYFPSLGPRKILRRSGHPSLPSHAISSGRQFNSHKTCGSHLDCDCWCLHLVGTSWLKGTAQNFGVAQYICTRCGERPCKRDYLRTFT